MNSNFGKKYYREINIARGIALVFVILGHCLDAVEMPSIAVWIYKFCYSFHMGLFFFLSGFVSKKYLREQVKISCEVRKKSKRLMRPYCIFSLITLLIKMAGGIIGEWDAQLLIGFLLGESVNESLWYLWTLFAISCIVISVCIKINRLLMTDRLILLFLLSIVLYIFFELFVFPYGLGNIFKYTIFYVLGMCIANNYVAVKPYIQDARMLLVVAEIAIIVLNFVQYNIWYIVTAFLGIYIVMVISLKICKRENAIYKIFDCFGKYSYEVYLLSYFIQTFIRKVGENMNINYWYVVFGMFWVSLIGPIWISKYFIRKSNKLMKVFGL